jgi:mRNA interferase HigB
MKLAAAGERLTDAQRPLHNGFEVGVEAGIRVRRRLAPILGACYVIAMRIIARRTLREFVEARRGHRDHSALKAAVDAWFDEARKARWSGTADVKRSNATASIISADRIVFNIKGNDYRLVVAVDFEKGIVWIKWIGTHRDYDRINVKKVQHGG